MSSLSTITAPVLDSAAGNRGVCAKGVDARSAALPLATRHFLPSLLSAVGVATTVKSRVKTRARTAVDARASKSSTHSAQSQAWQRPVKKLPT